MHPVCVCVCVWHILLKWCCIIRAKEEKDQCPVRSVRSSKVYTSDCIHTICLCKYKVQLVVLSAWVGFNWTSFRILTVQLINPRVHHSYSSRNYFIVSNWIVMDILDSQTHSVTIGDQTPVSISLARKGVKPTNRNWRLNTSLFKDKKCHKLLVGRIPKTDELPGPSLCLFGKQQGLYCKVNNLLFCT